MHRVPLLTSLALALALPAAASARPALMQPSSVRARASLAALPEVTSISPRKIAIGQTLTIRGRHFLPGNRRNTVVFQRRGGRYVFVRAGRSTRTRIRVKVPTKLSAFLHLRKGAGVPTRFRIRILARRFGAAFSSPARSPIVSPSTSGSGSGKCRPGAADSDGDGLLNATELKIHTDPCAVDTDGDGLTDFWEEESALDYNSRALPFPGKRPYPNALDPSDINIDHDGDGLTAHDEFDAWVKCGVKNPNVSLFLSDGTQSSGGRVATPAGAATSLDIDGNGVLTDDDRDSDLCDRKGIKGDGLSNWVEAHGPGVPAWWTKIIENEKPYGLSRFAALDFLDPDTDGDKLMDGADDVDHDGWTNRSEVSRRPLFPGGPAFWVQPFNPCLPDPLSATCSRHPPPPSSSWPPFDRKLGGATIPLAIDDPGIDPAPKGA
jgi:hypothetical protein